MKMKIWRAFLVIIFAVGCGLLCFGLTGFSGYLSPNAIYITEKYSAAFDWSLVSRYIASGGAFLIGIPIAIRFTRDG